MVLIATEVRNYISVYSADNNLCNMVLCAIILVSMAEREVNFTNASSLGPLSTDSEDYGRIILTPLVLDGSHSVNIVGLSLSLSNTPVSEHTLCGIILTDSDGNIVAVVQHTSE